MCNPATYLCHHRPCSSTPILWVGCSAHNISFYRARLIPFSWTCTPKPGAIIAKPPPSKVFCQRCRDKWDIAGWYEVELTKSISRVDEALKDTEYKLTGKEIQEGLRLVDELFRHEGLAAGGLGSVLH